MPHTLRAIALAPLLLPPALHAAITLEGFTRTLSIRATLDGANPTTLFEQSYTDALLAGPALTSTDSDQRYPAVAAASATLETFVHESGFSAHGGLSSVAQFWEIPSGQSLSVRSTVVITGLVHYDDPYEVYVSSRGAGGIFGNGYALWGINTQNTGDAIVFARTEILRASGAIDFGVPLSPGTAQLTVTFETFAQSLDQRDGADPPNLSFATNQFEFELGTIPAPGAALVLSLALFTRASLRPRAPRPPA